MAKFSGKTHRFKKLTTNQIEKWSQELIVLLKDTITKDIIYVEEYVAQLQKLNPEISNDSLIKKIISRRSWKAAGIGAICGVGGIITLPITMPTDLYICFRIQARMVLAIAIIYGWNIHDEDTITDILLVLGGNASKDALKNIGIKLGQELAKKGVNKFINREAMKKINKVISRKIITKAGEKSFTSFTKLVPIVGAPIGAAFDGFGTFGIGKTANKFYKG